VFDFVEEAFDQMALLVDEPIDFARLFAVAAGRDDGLHAPRLDRLDDGVGIVALVCDERLSPRRRQPEQRLRLAGVIGLAARQHEVQRVAKGVRDGVDLGAEPAARAAQRLGLRAAARRPRRARVGADDGGVDEDALQIGLLRAAPVQRLEHAPPAPAGIALEHRVPLAMLGGQQPPLRARPQHPQHRHQEKPAGRLRGHAGVRVRRQDRKNHGPLFVTDLKSVRHRHRQKPPDSPQAVAMSTEPSASLLLANIVVTPAGLAWLASDAEAFSAWLDCAAGDKATTGALGDILGKALRTFRTAPSVKPDESERSLPIENGQAEAFSSPLDRHEDMPLHERMLAALRDLVDGGNLPLDAMDAKGWRKGDDLWLESPAVVDALRGKLLQEWHGDTPSSNQNAIDVLHRQGVLVPCEGKAVWNVAVHDGNVERAVVALRIPVSRVWQDLALAPVEFAGTVEPLRNLPEDGQNKEAPAAKFVEWLRTGIAEGRIPCNERNARVHVVPEGVLLVTPNLFKDFVGECGGGRWETVQQLFVKRRDHVRTPNGENIHHYVAWAGPSQMALSGILLKDPSLVFDGGIPAPNPSIGKQGDDGL